MSKELVDKEITEMEVVAEAGRTIYVDTKVTARETIADLNTSHHASSSRTVRATDEIVDFHT